MRRGGSGEQREEEEKETGAPLAVTGLGVLLVPALYVMVEWPTGWRRRTLKPPAAGTNAEAVGRALRPVSRARRLHAGLRSPDTCSSASSMWSSRLPGGCLRYRTRTRLGGDGHPAGPEGGNLT